MSTERKETIQMPIPSLARFRRRVYCWRAASALALVLVMLLGGPVAASSHWHHAWTRYPGQAFSPSYMDRWDRLFYEQYDRRWLTWDYVGYNWARKQFGMDVAGDRWLGLTFDLKNNPNWTSLNRWYYSDLPGNYAWAENDNWWEDGTEEEMNLEIRDPWGIIVDKNDYQFYAYWYDAHFRDFGQASPWGTVEGNTSGYLFWHSNSRADSEWVGKTKIDQYDNIWSE